MDISLISAINQRQRFHIDTLYNMWSRTVGNESIEHLGTSEATTSVPVTRETLTETITRVTKSPNDVSSTNMQTKGITTTEPTTSPASETSTTEAKSSTSTHNGVAQITTESTKMDAQAGDDGWSWMTSTQDDGDILEQVDPVAHVTKEETTMDLIKLPVTKPPATDAPFRKIQTRGITTTESFNSATLEEDTNPTLSGLLKLPTSMAPEEEDGWSTSTTLGSEPIPNDDAPTEGFKLISFRNEVCECNAVIAILAVHGWHREGTIWHLYTVWSNMWSLARRLAKYSRKNESEYPKTEGAIPSGR